MRLLLAPMEGVLDHHLRALMSSIGGIDICVTEFIRVNEHLMSTRTFTRNCPELLTHSRTASGTPVRVQLLGGQPAPMAENAAMLATLNPAAIDLNFGCPAKTVNKSDGGAVLLQTPERLYNIISAVRQAVPNHIPVTAKIRLGFNDRSMYLENAQAALSAGANELAVHARSKADGYKPPAYWEYVAEINSALPIPVIANGEIWSLDDYRRCKAVTGCEDFMMGRGLLAFPDLAKAIHAEASGEHYTPMPWKSISLLLWDFQASTSRHYPDKYLGNRVKQWLMYLQRQYPQAQRLFDEIKRLKTADDINQKLTESQAWLS